jgi:hypothetical protein
MQKSLTQIMKGEGFKIKTKIITDHLGIAHIVIIERDGKRLQRRARKYEEALELCSEGWNKTY